MATLLTLPLGKQAPIHDRTILYRQYDGVIKSVVSATSIKVYGDASAFFSNGDVVLVPLKDFTDEIIVDGAAVYNGVDNDTTIDFVSGSFSGSTDLGLTVTKKVEVTNYVMINSNRAIETRIEGTLLNDFDNGFYSFVVDNSAGFFWNSTNTGIIQTSAVIWAKVIFNYHGDATENLVFGGLVDSTDLGVDLHTRQITLKIIGQAGELQRYPAYLVNDSSNTRCVQVTGINIVSFTSNINTEAGIKNLQYDPFGSSPMRGIEVDSVSFDTKPGMKYLEFRYPNFFRWDNGDWRKIGSIADYDDAANATVKMYALGGSGDSNYAIVKFGSADTLADYPDVDTAILVDVKLQDQVPTRRAIGDQGKPTLTFDNGKPVLLMSHFGRVVLYDDSGGTYTEITDAANTFDVDDVMDILAGDDDYLLVVSPDPFYGIEFFAEENSGFTTSTIEYSYSIGGINFSSAMDLGNNGLTDETNELQNSGKIRWSTADGWTVNAIIVSDTEAYIGYMIKITRVAATGSCPMQEIRRLLRLQGQNNDYLEVIVHKDSLQPFAAEEDVVIEVDALGVHTAKLWYNNVTLHTLAVRALDRANYPASKRNLSDLKITRPVKYFNVWGTAPVRNYHLKPTAMTKIGDTIYVAMENEIWKSAVDGQWEFVANFDPFSFIKAKFHGIFNGATGDLLVYCAQRLDKYYNPSSDTHYGLRLVSVDGSTINDLSSSNVVDLREGIWLRRMGRSVFGPISGSYYRAIGQDLTSDTGSNSGENLCLPYSQYVVVGTPEGNNALKPAIDIDNTAVTFDYPFWVFDNVITGDTTGWIVFVKQGYWQVEDFEGDASPNDPIDVFHTFGNQGNLFFDHDRENVYTFAVIADANNDPVVALRGAGTNVSAKYTKIRYYEHDGRCDRACGWIRSTVSETLFFFGWTEWFDDGDDTKSYSYISRASIVQAAEWDKVFKENTAVFTDITTNTNNGTTSNNVILAVNDAVYFGSDSKFRNLDCQFSNHSNNYAFEYWDGAAWTALTNVAVDDTLLDDALCFSVPRDWATTTVNGVANTYWVRVRCTNFVASANLVLGKMLELIYFDSQEYDGGGFERYMPISLCFNPDEALGGTLHGCFFNRESGDAFPFQWSYFVFDLAISTLTITRTGDNYTFDSSFIYRDFVFNTFDSKVYGMAVNRRYEDKTAFLFRADYDTDTTTITLTKEGEPVANENDNAVPLIHDAATGNIFGITKGSQNAVWEFGLSFYPRVEVGKFSESDTIKTVLRYISEIANFYYDVTPQREIDFIERSGYRNDYELRHDTALQESKYRSGFWKHRYDGVQIGWENQFIGQRGEYKKGFDGWNRKVLRLSNPLISNIHLARIVGDQLYDFFTRFRIQISGVKIIFAPQVRPLDRVSMVLPDFIANFDKTLNFIVTKQNASLKNHTVEIEILEI